MSPLRMYSLHLRTRSLKASAGRFQVSPSGSVAGTFAWP